MANQISGYSHAVFSYGSYLRKYAEQADDKANGGNDNGVIDGNEINKFKEIVKAKTGYNFDFSKISQVENKTIAIQENNKFIYHTTTDVANKYGNAVTTKTVDWMNGKQPGKDLFVPSRKTIDIPFMSDDEYKTSKAAVEKQELEVRKRVEKQNAEKKAKEAEELHENTKSWFEKICDAIKKP